VSVTNEWGQIEQDMTAKLTADLSTSLRTIAAVPEDLADDFSKAFPACLVSFAGASVSQKVYTSAGPTFASLASATYVALLYVSSGKTPDQSRYGATGIYELEKLVRVALMGYAPPSQADLNHNLIYWDATDPVQSISTKAGSGLLKMKTTFVIDQLVTATAT
jgi:hypothetical protein